MGGNHPEDFHRHLMSSSLSDHALTGDSSKDKKARQGTHFTPSLLFLPLSEQIQLSPPPRLFTRLPLHYTFAQNIRLLGMVLSAAGSPYHWQCLPIVSPRSWLLTALLGILRARLTHRRRRHHLCHHYSQFAASP